VRRELVLVVDDVRHGLRQGVGIVRPGSVILSWLMRQRLILRLAKGIVLPGLRVERWLRRLLL
jgi:hypothetical protein